MSTNAVITIKNFPGFALYKHWDGYPEATLAWLEKFNKEFVENRGNDLQYKAAQLIRSSVFDQEEFDLDESRYTGWGVLTQPTCGHFNYVLMPDGSVKVERG